MVRSTLGAAAVTGTIAFGLLLGLNCGTSTTTPAGGGGSTSNTPSAGGGDTASHAAPPAPGPTEAPDGTSSVTFALKKLYLGDTDWDGKADTTNGWKHFGYDLDGKVSTASSNDLCKPAPGGQAKNVYPDGDNGIDNAFGHSILPIILNFVDGATINDAILSGKFSVLLNMDKLGTGTSYNPILTRLYAGIDLSAPAWDGTDKWPVVPELLSSTSDINSSTVKFPSSYLANNTWVSGPKTDIVLSLSIAGVNVNLSMASAVLSMELDQSHKTATKGIIAGVLKTDTLVTEIKKLAGAFSPSLCSGGTIDSIAALIAATSDIMSDGTQDPSKTCDGISIGLGFEATVAQLGEVAPAAAPWTNPCSGDAGTATTDASASDGG